jgi:hypothetical protein
VVMASPGNLMPMATNCQRKVVAQGIETASQDRRAVADVRLWRYRDVSAMSGYAGMSVR